MDKEYGFEFRHQYDENGPEIILRLKNADANLDKVLEAFGAFLKAAGYSLPGELQFLEEGAL